MPSSWKSSRFLCLKQSAGRRFRTEPTSQAKYEHEENTDPPQYTSSSREWSTVHMMQHSRETKARSGHWISTSNPPGAIIETRLISHTDNASLRNPKPRRTRSYKAQTRKANTRKKSIETNMRKEKTTKQRTIPPSSGTGSKDDPTQQHCFRACLTK
jgi:hypothetical protein